MKKQAKKAAAPSVAAADGNDDGITDRNDDGNEDGAGQGAIPDEVLESPTRGVVTSPKAEHLNDRMKLARKPNDAEPLAHRNRSKAGRKG